MRRVKLHICWNNLKCVKKKLALLFTMLSMLLLLFVDKGSIGMQYDNERGQSHVAAAVHDVEQSFSQADNFIDLNGRRGSSTTFSTSHSTAKSAPERRVLSNLFSGVRVAIASLYSDYSYARSCDFPFDHKPQKELFFILRNIRI